MNLVFHTVFSVSTSPIVAKNIVKTNKPLRYLGLGFASNIIMHGVMDLVPHDYPVTTMVDISISFVLFLLSIIFVKRELRNSVFFCFLGGVLPDLIDKGLFRVLRMNSIKLFPWHWANVINFFYKWYFNHAWLFSICNALAIIVSVGLLLINRRFIFESMLKYTNRE
ncbi:hypothetical protein [Acetivibrio mesophilus]|uniref:Uncharacterized protein n=1 Tax=Acetivibrio mesophilus TaxID=2487273 RepID=A0A4Q0I1C0_9FIRM|nr:hypothetical protein [Acetivibrio mesophilus]ODM25933.1 hypothetical protein A7W90_06665 [Clostridium sp. Bc-iso-3]RXE57923.1 hypothetical protein EFD62_14940 [Acetivibrio mesophilus]HHV30617.1 hypothetical protein [Clostridium sp.]